jgi:hypothetical protein
VHRNGKLVQVQPPVLVEIGEIPHATEVLLGQARLCKYARAHLAVYATSARRLGRQVDSPVVRKVVRRDRRQAGASGEGERRRRAAAVGRLESAKPGCCRSDWLRTAAGWSPWLGRYCSEVASLWLKSMSAGFQCLPAPLRNNRIGKDSWLSPPAPSEA